MAIYLDDMQPGQSKLGPYLLLRQLAEGGMGIVYEAIHEKIRRRVAIKVLNRQHAASVEVRARLFHEAIAVNVVDHPGLVQISDYDELPDGTAFLVMEYLPGETLLARVESRQAAGSYVPIDEALSIAWQLADALAAAHAKNVVHRDLKPENVMLVRDPVVIGGVRAKILDFGIAKLRAIETSVKTRTRMLMGTPAYMSPEQCRGAGRIDERSDCYSFGVLLYFTLAGRLPFVSEGPYELIAMHLRDPAPPLILGDATDQELADFVMTLLQKEPTQRPTMATATAFFAELLRRRGIQSGSQSGSAVERAPIIMQARAALSPSAPTQREPPQAAPVSAATEELSSQVPGAAQNTTTTDAATTLSPTDIKLDPSEERGRGTHTASDAKTELPHQSRTVRRVWPVVVALVLTAIAGGAWIRKQNHPSPSAATHAVGGGGRTAWSAESQRTAAPLEGDTGSPVHAAPPSLGTLPIRPADEIDDRLLSVADGGIKRAVPVRPVSNGTAIAATKGSAATVTRTATPQVADTHNATAVERPEESAADLVRRQFGMPLPHPAAPVAPTATPPAPPTQPRPSVQIPAPPPDDTPSPQLISPDELLVAEEQLAAARVALTQRRCQDVMNLASPWTKARPAVAWLLIGEAACCLKYVQLARTAKQSLRGYPAQQKTLVTRCPGL